MAKVSRRVFLSVISTVGAAASVGALAACGGKPKEFSCNDVGSLPEADKTLRTSVKYVDKSQEPGKKCDNCLQYTKAAGEGQCGGCKVVKGPIHPDGYCTLWAKMGLARVQGGQLDPGFLRVFFVEQAGAAEDLHQLRAGGGGEVGQGVAPVLRRLGADLDLDQFMIEQGPQGGEDQPLRDPLFPELDDGIEGMTQSAQVPGGFSMKHGGGMPQGHLAVDGGLPSGSS